ncbi:MAG: four helix bundle protein [Nitrospirota bacterium]
MSIKCFEDIICWQQARKLVSTIYDLTSSVKFNKDFGLKDQIQRASVSVMSNIAEGFGRGGNKELVQYLFIAKGSLAEVRSLLYVAKDLSYINESSFSTASKIASETDRLIGAFIKSIKIANKGDLRSSVL